jgi:hypothetical protein
MDKNTKYGTSQFTTESQYVLAQSLLNEYGGENVEGTTDDLNIPFYAKNKKNAVPAFELN